MKKIIIFLCAISMLLFSVSCGKTENESSEISSSSTSEMLSDDNETTTIIPKETVTNAVSKKAEVSTESTQPTVTDATETSEKHNISDMSGLSIDVNNDKTVEITIPATLITDIDATIAEVESNERILSYTLNDDGSLTYQYSQKDYDIMLDEYKNTVHQKLQDIVTSGLYSSITAIDNNNDFTDIKVTVTDQSSYENSLDAISNLSIMITAEFYQIISGIKDPSVTIHIIDNNGNEFKTVTY